MLAGLGAFAGGLTQGIRQNQELAQRQQYIDMQAKQHDMLMKRDARDQETHDMNMDQLKKLRTANQEVADLLTSSQQPTMPVAQPDNTQVSDTRAPGLSMAAPQVSDTRAPGLSAAPTPQEPQMPAGQIIAKNMLTGNTLQDPDKLTAIANIYARHGLTDKMVPWLTQAYQAKKSGLVDALPYLMAGDAQSAAALLKRGGMDIQGTPTLVDKENGVWSFNIGGQQREVSMRQLVGMADPENWAKNEMDRNKTQADIDLKKAQTDYYKGAKTELAEAQAKRQGRLGGGSGGKGGSSGPKVQRTMETENGIIAVMSDGTHKPILSKDGKPLYGTKNLEISSRLVGKTINEFGDNSDIAGKVNDVAGQLGGRQPEKEAPSSAPVRKFNPKTGKFE